MSVAIPRKFYQPLLIAGALAFVYFTVLEKLGRDWWHDENYSHGLLIPFVIVYILWQERKRFQAAKTRPAVWFGAIGVIISLLALWAGTAGAELFLQRISLVVMLASVAIFFWGFRLLRLVFVPLSLLVLAIPIPQIVFNKIAFPLQLFASRCAVGAMSLLNIPVLRQGNVIELMPLGASTPKKLAVVEACSGIRSLNEDETSAFPARCGRIPQKLHTLALAAAGDRGRAYRDTYKCPARQRHRSAGALLWDPRG